MVYRLALLHVNNASDADDVFQEVFIRLVKHIQKLQNWEHIKAWLIRVTINCSNTQFERAAFKKNVPLEEVMESGFDEEGFEEAEGDGPVVAAVKKLPVKYRSVVHLFYYEELSIAEIAAYTQQKETTVKSQLFRAREMLKEMLEGEIAL
jgi:RNA polymerase sigma-70 factor (ECF subfamily)